MSFLLFFALLPLHLAGALDCSITDYGAVGDNSTLNTIAFQRAISDWYSCACGIFVTAPFNLTSNMTLRVDGTLAGSTNAMDYPLVRSLPVSSKPMWQALVAVYYAENVAIVGTGTIDGRGAPWWRNFTAGTLKHQRPKLVEPVYVRNLTIANVTLRDSPFWTLHPTFCQDVVIRGVTTLAPRPVGNTDGIDVDACQDVLVEECHVDVGDDGICVKSGTDFSGKAVMAARILIRHCNIVSRNFAIGSDTSGGIVNVTLEDTRIGNDQGSSPWAIKIKSHEAYTTAVRNITFQRIQMGRIAPNTYQQPNGGTAIQMYMTYGSPPSPSPSRVHTIFAPIFSGIAFINVTATSAVAPGSLVGLAQSPIHQLTLQNVDIPSAHSWHCQFVDPPRVARNVTPPFCKT